MMDYVSQTSTAPDVSTLMQMLMGGQGQPDPSQQPQTQPPDMGQGIGNPYASALAGPIQQRLGELMQPQPWWGRMLQGAQGALERGHIVPGDLLMRLIMGATNTPELPPQGEFGALLNALSGVAGWQNAGIRGARLQNQLTQQQIADEAAKRTGLSPTKVETGYRPRISYEQPKPPKPEKPPRGVPIQVLDANGNPTVMVVDPTKYGATYGMPSPHGDPRHQIITQRAKLLGDYAAADPSMKPMLRAEVENLDRLEQQITGEQVPDRQWPQEPTPTATPQGLWNRLTGAGAVQAQPQATPTPQPQAAPAEPQAALPSYGVKDLAPEGRKAFAKLPEGATVRINGKAYLKRKNQLVPAG